MSIILWKCAICEQFNAVLFVYCAPFEINLITSHYGDVTMSAMASQITRLTIVYSIVYSDQRKHQSSASLAFVRGIDRSPVNSPHKRPETRKMLPFDDVIMQFIAFLIDIGKIGQYQTTTKHDK